MWIDTLWTSPPPSSPDNCVNPDFQMLLSMKWSHLSHGTGRIEGSINYPIWDRSLQVQTAHSRWPNTQKPGKQRITGATFYCKNCKMQGIACCEKKPYQWWVTNLGNRGSINQDNRHIVSEHTETGKTKNTLGNFLLHLMSDIEYCLLWKEPVSVESYSFRKQEQKYWG